MNVCPVFPLYEILSLAVLGFRVEVGIRVTLVQRVVVSGSAATGYTLKYDIHVLVSTNQQIIKSSCTVCMNSIARYSKERYNIMLIATRVVINKF